jgi:intracellular septation protein
MSRTAIIAFFAEFGPLIAFFIAGQLTEFFTAVAVLMGTTFIAVTTSWILDRRIPWLPVISAALVIIGGAITLVYRAPDVIILADTIYYLMIATGIGVSLWRRDNLLKRLFGTVFALTEEGWRILAWRWFWCLLFAAGANEVARHFLTPEWWIAYRLTKSVFLSLFAIYQFTLARQYRLVAESNAWGLRTTPPTPPPVGQRNDV